MMTEQASAGLPTLADIEAAAKRIAPYAVRTPLLEFTALNERVGGRVLIKPECLQRTGSFKFRGAFNACSQIDDGRRRSGIVASSSGNHAQGIAEASRLLGCPATIVMPSDAPSVKRDRVAASGAEIVDYHRSSEDRIAIARDITDRRHATFVHPFDNFDVVAGQGTVGLEIVDDLDARGIKPTRYICCCGGGGLLTGSSTALRAAYPDLEVIGVEPDDFNDWARSLEAGTRLDNDRSSGSVCDALLTPHPGALPWRIANRVGLRIATVSDEAALAAVRYAYETFRLVVEPGGAVALAHLLTGESQSADDVSVVVLSGGNIDLETLQRALA